MFLFIALNRGDCARWFNFTDKSIANHFLLCNPCCIWRTTAYFTLDKLIHCCLTTYSPDIRIKPVWDSQSELIVNLHIEYTSGFGKSDLLLGTRGTFYDVIHKKGYLTKFPDNICKFQDIVKVDLSEKEIDSLIGIHCLFLLDTLILKGNSMEMITNSSFSTLPFLRHVDLSKNKISHIDPGSLAYQPRSLLYINLSFNNLKIQMY